MSSCPLLFVKSRQNCPLLINQTSILLCFTRSARTSSQNIRTTTRSNNIARAPESRVRVITIRQSFNSSLRTLLTLALHVSINPGFGNIDGLLHNTTFIEIPPGLDTVLRVKQARIATFHHIDALFGVETVESVLGAGGRRSCAVENAGVGAGVDCLSKCGRRDGSSASGGDCKC